jgi:hypothetical protein
MTEYVFLSAALLVGGVALSTFAPDALMTFTIYLRGVYLILGLPVG